MPDFAPEQRLLHAMLLDAIDCARRGDRDARDWFCSDRDIWLGFTSQRVCDALDLDHAAVVGALQKQWSGRCPVPECNLGYVSRGRGRHSDQLTLLPGSSIVPPPTWASVVKRHYPVGWYGRPRRAA